MEINNREIASPFITKDKSEIRVILDSLNCSTQKLSLAEALVKPNEKTDLHIHKTSEEIYFILEGEGEMIIESESKTVKKWDGIYIANGKKHKIINTGESDLIFLCICTPPYQHEDTVIFE